MSIVVLIMTITNMIRLMKTKVAVHADDTDDDYNDDDNNDEYYVYGNDDAGMNLNTSPTMEMKI